MTKSLAENRPNSVAGPGQIAWQMTLWGRVDGGSPTDSDDLAGTLGGALSAVVVRRDTLEVTGLSYPIGSVPDRS